jgi:hypothetical protein
MITELKDSRHMMQRQKEMEGGHTFRPNIGNASVILQCSLQDGNEETLDERLERLSHRDSQRRFHIRQRISVSSFL